MKTEIWDIFGSLEFSVVTRLPDLVIFLTNFENKVLVDFFEFECLNMLDNADYDSNNGSFPLGNHELRSFRA